MNIRYLTKSRFKLATECPTKLFYTGKSEYPDQSMTDSFLAALAEGGFQVGELAKAYHPDGHDVEALDYVTALEETNALLKQENVTIFEAAVRFENLFIRIDVLRKRGNVFDLVEVKAKSFENEAEFTAKKSGKISSDWKPYLIDVAFQEYVLRKAFPDTSVRSHLMLANKNARTSVDGLNQHFKIEKNSSGRTQARMVGDVSSEALGSRMLREVDVRDYVHELQSDTYEVNGNTYSFEEYINFLASRYETDERVQPHIECGVCAKCQFKATSEEEAQGKLSGYKSCWKEAQGFSDADFSLPSVLDLWNFRKKQEFLETSRFFMRDLSEDDFDLEKSTQERQWLQVEKTIENDPKPWFDFPGLRKAIASWQWPLHFIDFETSTVAIPFTKARRPYEVVAFQFSHHQVNKDGSIEHVDEFLEAAPGVFPNFEFVRRLKASLDKDNGTIFRYAAHENTVLNHIMRQLEGCEDDVPDRDELIEWIKTITHNSTTGWVGSRDMVDMLELVKQHYYQLDMGGSNSIKKVLPAVLNSSKYLQEKYCQPIYNSRNFPNQIWLQKDDVGRLVDPYKLLPPIFADIPQEDLDKVLTDESLADGGAAMTAYARLQFSDIPDVGRQATRQALLRYCELDTLAMVMIWEAWNDALARENDFE
ncbi:MAG: DUF2779 domain-containing protein [Desulfuromusa sp.]